MVRMAYIQKDTYIFEAVEETEDSSPHILEADCAMSLSEEFLTAMRDEFQSAVGSAMKAVLRTTVEKPLRDIFLGGYKAADESM